MDVNEVDQKLGGRGIGVMVFFLTSSVQESCSWNHAVHRLDASHLFLGKYDICGTHAIHDIEAYTINEFDFTTTEVLFC